MKPLPVITDNSELRKFGLLFPTILLVLFDGLLPWLRNHPLPLWPLYIGAPIGALALVWPAALRPVYVAWMKFGAVMGFINTRIIMAIFFFAILTPIGWLIRLSGKDTLARGFNRQSSYRNINQPRNKDHLEKPY